MFSLFGNKSESFFSGGICKIKTDEEGNTTYECEGVSMVPDTLGRGARVILGTTCLFISVYFLNYDNKIAGSLFFCASMALYFLHLAEKILIGGVSKFNNISSDNIPLPKLKHT